MHRPWIFRGILLLAACAALLLSGIGRNTRAVAQDGDTQEAPPAPVRVAEAQARPMARALQVSGTVVSRHDARLAAEIPGRLDWVAEVGDVVAKGEAVARLDKAWLDLQRQRDEARVRRLEIQLAHLDKELDRLRALTDQQIAARNQLDELASRHAIAEQDLLEARLSLEQTSHQLARTRIVAPFPGQVVERLQQPGEYTAVGGAVVRLVDVGHTEVSARAPLDVATHVRPGMDVQLEGGSVGRVRAIIPVGDERSRMLEARIELPTDRPWVVGSAVRLALPGSAERQAVAVPRDALVLRSGETYLFKVAHDSTVERVDVDTGVGHGDLIEVQGNVQAGDRVVVRGGERLQTGQRVSVQDE